MPTEDVLILLESRILGLSVDHLQHLVLNPFCLIVIAGVSMTFLSCAATNRIGRIYAGCSVITQSQTLDAVAAHLSPRSTDWPSESQSYVQRRGSKMRRRKRSFRREMHLRRSRQVPRRVTRGALRSKVARGCARSAANPAGRPRTN